MKKIVLATIFCLGLIGCSNDTKKTEITNQEAKLSPKTEELIKALNNTYPVKFQNSIAGDKILLDYKIGENQNIKLYINADGTFSHIFVEQRGEQPLEQVKSQLINTCKVVANNVAPNLLGAVEIMQQNIQKYENARVSEQTAIKQDDYYLMLDFSRYKMADCLISTTPVQKIVKTFSEPVVPTQITPEQAHEFAKKLYKKIENDEKFLNDAFELKEYRTLEQYVLRDWQAYVDIPYGESEAKPKFGHAYFPDSDIADPYAVCDTAFTDLKLFAGAMMNLVREDKAVLRKIYRQEQEDFMKSKAACAKRVNMTYDQALADSEK